MRTQKWIVPFCKTCFPLLLVFFVAVQHLSAGSYTVIHMNGRVRISDASGQSHVPAIDEVIEGPTYIRTFRDSSITLHGEEYYYRLHAATLVRLREEPLLAYGKLSKSVTKEFVDLHFYYLPAPAQGKTMKVAIRSSDSDIEVTSSLLLDNGKGRELSVYPQGGGRYRALTGFDCEAEAVRYNLHIMAQSEQTGSTHIIYPFFLKETRFPTGKVVLPPVQEELLKPSEKKRRQSERLIEVLSTSSNTSLWDASFSHPLENAQIISAFGKKRTYYLDGKPIRVRHHRGVDYRAPQGTAVYSPGNGIVVLSAERVTTGNTLVIDHGHRVFTLFFHLDKLLAEEGDRVYTGDSVAEAGSTGIAAGSHLHWGLWIDGTYVDPLDWIKRHF